MMLSMWISNYIIRLVIAINGYVLNILRSILFPCKINPNNIKRIIIYRTGSLGDTICSLPAISAIREKYPEAELHILTHSGGFKDISFDTIIDQSVVDKIISYENIGIKQLMHQLRKNKYQVLILFPQVHATFGKFVKDLFFARIIGVKNVFGFKRCVIRVFPQIQAKMNIVPNVRDFLLSIAQDAGCSLLDHKSYPLQITETDIQYVNQIFLASGLSQDTILAAITIGAKREQNRWPLAYFDLVIQFLINKNFGCIIIGGKDDTNLVNLLSTKTQVTDLTGKLTVMQSACAISKCSIMITNDTGPMHLAYAVNTYVFAIFSSRDFPGLWYPPKETSTVFRGTEILCSECFSANCKFNNKCINSINPDMVINSISQHIDAQ